MIKCLIAICFLVQSEDTVLTSPCRQVVSTIAAHRVGRADNVCTHFGLGR